MHHSSEAHRLPIAVVAISLVVTAMRADTALRWDLTELATALLRILRCPAFAWASSRSCSACATSRWSRSTPQSA